MTETTHKSWREVGFDYVHPRVISMLFLGFSAGIPILLIFSSLGLWLREAGVDRSATTMFSWAALAYSFKFVWAPLIDRLPLPFLTRLLGRRRAWMLVSQFSIMLAIFWMAVIDPASKGEFTLMAMAMAAVLLGFSSATQDIVIDAYRIEAAHKDSQAVISSIYIAGYRIGMLVAGAGALFLASHWGSTTDSYSYTAWLWTYQSMALVMLVGVVTTLIVPEPAKFQSMSQRLSAGYLLVLATLLFAANELTFFLVESDHPLYIAFVWLVRALFAFSIFSLRYRLISKNTDNTHERFFESSTLDKSGLVILGIALLAWLGSFFISQNYHFIWLFIILLTIIFIATYIRQRVDALVQEKQTDDYNHSTADYLGFLLLFVVSVLGFILTYVLTSDLVNKLASLDLYANSGFFKSFVNALVTVPTGIASLTDNLADFFGNKKLANLLMGTLRLFTAIAVAVSIASVLSKTRMVNAEMVHDTYVAPIKDFFSRYGLNLAILLLALIGLYRISDIVLGVIANVFYQDIGYSKVQIATIVKTFGLFMTLAGGFLGGILALRYGVMKTLFLGAFLTVVTNLLFVLLAKMGTNDPIMLYLVISADNLTGGLATAAFVAFLSSLTNVQFTAVQYAIFSSLMTLIPKVIGGYSGSIVESFCKGQETIATNCMLGYENFFLIASAMGVPVLLLVWLAGKYLNISEFKLKE